MDITALTGTYPILDGERAAGTLEVTPQGGYLRFRAECAIPGRELRRLAARSGETGCELGVLAPEGGLWRLDRRLSPAQLRALGLERIDACFLRGPAPEGWTPEPSPGGLLRDALLRRLCAGVTGALTRREGGRTLLALPLTQPFPLLPAFCLGTLRVLEGKTYLVFGIFDGKPGMISPAEGQASGGRPQIRKNGSVRNGKSDDQGTDRAGRPDPA